MAATARHSLEGSLVGDALDRVAETLTLSVTHLTQSLEGVREAARQEALNSERRLQEALSRAEERFQEALSRAEERFQKALSESEERAVARSAEQCRRPALPSTEERNYHGRTENKELEGRMQILEDSLKTALGRVFPRVERLVQQLEERPPPSPSITPSSAPPSVACSLTEPPSSSPNHSPPTRSSAPTNTASSLSSDSEASLGMALYKEAKRGQLKVVRRLLDDGANVNFRNKDGWTPLHVAADSDFAHVVRLLVERGADVNAVTNRGSTALHFCDVRCMGILLAAGADLNAQDTDTWTPLHYAAAGGREWTARALLAAGASKTLRSEDGHMPYQLASSSSLSGILLP